jgi:hypothetical protein
MLLFSSHVEANISHNDNKNVANCIMGSYVFVVMGMMQKMDTHKVDGMCAHTSKDTSIDGCGKIQVVFKAKWKKNWRR